MIFWFGVWGDQVFFLLQLFALFSLSLSNEGRGGAPLAVIFLFGVWGDQVFFLLQLFALFSLSLALTRAGGVPLSL